jgi:hypothetical protein
LDFRKIFFFCKARSSALHPTPNLEDQSLYLCPSVTGWPTYTPRHWVPFSPQDRKRSSFQSVVFCLEYLMMDKAQKPHNPKCKIQPENLYQQSVVSTHNFQWEEVQLAASWLSD